MNPRPLEPVAALGTLLDALEEAAKRRVLSVANGEQYKASHAEIIPMPDGHEVFETKGAWEDFATPSRDMRLLIAIDTVRAFTAQVRKAPARFGLDPGSAVDGVVAGLDAHLNAELSRRRLAYTRSDGSSFELSLSAIIERSKAFEAAYNPNDCVEVRWGAPEGSAERTPCRRHAPVRQLLRHSLLPPQPEAPVSHLVSKPPHHLERSHRPEQGNDAQYDSYLIFRHNRCDYLRTNAGGNAVQ